jgi:hypothetical protein
VPVDADDGGRILRIEGAPPGCHIRPLRTGIGALIGERETGRATQMRRFSLASATKLVRPFVGAFAVATCLLAVHQPANAMGCLKGAMLGGIAGHMKHHTFLGIFGGCAGGIFVHHLYSRWKKAHPNGTMNDFVSANKDRLPEGWADRLSAVGETSDLPAGNRAHGQ